MAGGKIIFPAPKNTANKVNVIDRSCLAFIFSILVLFQELLCELHSIQDTFITWCKVFFLFLLLLILYNKQIR